MKILSLDIGGTEIKSGLVENAKLTYIKRYSSSESVKEGKIVEKVFSIIEENTNEEIEGISISTAGDVDPYNGEIVFATSNFKNYKGTKLKERVENKFNIKCEVINDVHSALYWELDNFPDTINKRVAMITLGTGVGGAMAIDGDIVFGENYDAYRLGHLCYEINGIECGCGKKGCIEQYVSASKLSKMAKDKGYNKGLKNLFIDYNKKNQNAISIVEDYFKKLEKAVLTIKENTNFDLLIIGGGITGSKNLWFDNFMSISSIKNMNIQIAKSGNDAGMLGAYKWFAKRNIK